MAHRLASFIVVLATLFALPAGAADLKVISAGAVRGLIAQIIDDYSAKTGQKFDFTIGTTGQLRDIIASGQHADLIIVSTPLMGELEKTGKLTPGSRAELGRVGIGVAVKDGARVPDVSTPEAFKKALVEAKSVAYTNPAEGGTSGIYFNGLTEQTFMADLGVADPPLVDYLSLLLSRFIHADVIHRLLDKVVQHTGSEPPAFVKCTVPAGRVFLAGHVRYATNDAYVPQQPAY